MTTDNSRADALTPCVHADDPKACYRVRCQLGGKCVDDDMSPRQPAAAPIDCGETLPGEYTNAEDLITALHNPPPSPADERAISDGMQNFACYLIDNCEGETITEESIQAWLGKALANPRYARPASANETVAEGATCCKRQMDNGDPVEPQCYECEERAICKRDESSSPAMAAEAVSIGDYDLNTSTGGRGYIAEFFAKRVRNHHYRRYIEERLAADFACTLAQYLRDRDVAPQPAQADARVGLTKQHAEAVGCLTVRRFRGADSMVNTDFDYYGNLPDGSYPLYIGAAPEPRAEVTDAMVAAAAKTLSDRSADACNINRDDNWMIYGECFQQDAMAALEAALAARTGASS